MPNINDRIGSQNVIRVLSNASAPPTKIINLTDVNAQNTSDGVILVWNSPSETFIMTSVIDRSTSISDTTVSISTTTGAFTVKGGVGVGGNTNIGGNLIVSGTSNFIGSVTFYGGTINLGDSDTDDINVVGEFISNLVPNLDATYDIGTSQKRWRNARFSGLVTATNLNVSGIATFQNDVIVTGTLTSGLIDGGEY
jgi:hypothetical protein